MSIISTQSFTFRLIANGTELDIFKDEDIFLSNNVTGLFDIGVLPSDFTRQITLPGTKVNNAFFEHVYDISIDNPFLFATNVKVPAYFEFDSVYLSQGYIQLNKVNLRANKFIESYEITIYGTLSSFSREVNRLYLTDLTSLAKYNHTASYANIAESWNTGSTGLFNRDIVYPLADYGQGWQFTPNELNTGIDDNTNQQQGLSVMDFKPAIRVKAVWDAIFEQTGYTYSSSFINSGVLDDVYMLCNNALKYPEFAGVDLETLGLARIAPFSGSGQTDLVIPSGTITNLPWYNVESDPSNVVGDNSSYTVTLDHSSSLQGIINLNINLSGSLGGPVLALYMRETGSLTTKSNSPLNNLSTYFYDLTLSDFAAGNTGQNQTVQVQQSFSTDVVAPGTYYFGLEWGNYFNAPYNNFKFKLDPGGQPKSYLEIKKVRQAADGRIMDIPSNMPYGTTGIKLVDFISGIQKKYNLVIYADNTKQNNFIVETFNNWYSKGKVKDFNRYINLDASIEVIPANNFAVNKLNFGDTLDNDYVAQQFAKGANREFGKIYYTDTENYFSQGTFEVKTTFASEPLLYVQGTGLSGSVGGFNPPITQYQVGYLKVSRKPAGADTCSALETVPFYTFNGLVTTSLVAYYDPYGNTPITGYESFIDLSGQAWDINPSNGQIGFPSGYYC
jgi:hypothetical protein